MKTYRQKIMDSSYFYWVIYPPILIVLLIIYVTIQYPHVPITSYMGGALIVIGATLTGFSNMRYVTTSDNQICFCSGIFTTSVKTCRYGDISKAVFISSVIRGTYIEVFNKEAKPQKFMLYLVSKTDLKFIAKDLEQYGVIVDISKLPDKLK